MQADGATELLCKCEDYYPMEDAVQVGVLPALLALHPPPYTLHPALIFVGLSARRLFAHLSDEKWAACTRPLPAKTSPKTSESPVLNGQAPTSLCLFTASLHCSPSSLSNGGAILARLAYMIVTLAHYTQFAGRKISAWSMLKETRWFTDNLINAFNVFTLAYISMYM